ncbi:DUF5994 family protein [Streptomyces halobius]|uniref:DUF5994 family protein n=1 Tax=Streptomyces halobius TaxID=2879846 RepID=A0ABY4MDB9_9ACTN|nr:DUF5994 family protein [Streptomyces halobius]UQA94405.1 DUF5994 family protein [Streptomyces halobius]
MTTASGAHPEHPAPPPVARLAIAPHSGTARRIDGIWWPHSTDLVTELPELLAALPFDWPRMTHVTVNGARWPKLPCHILVGGHVVRLRRTANRPGPDTVCLVSTGVGRWDLLLLPPDTPEAEAIRAMSDVAGLAGR